MNKASLCILALIGAISFLCLQGAQSQTQVSYKSSLNKIHFIPTSR